MAAWLYIKTYPDVECLVAQFESENPVTGVFARQKHRPMERWCDMYISTRCTAAMSSSIGQLMARQRMPVEITSS
eukprot:606051-Pleurochrysis_carterae.AAC.1